MGRQFLDPSKRLPGNEVNTLLRKILNIFCTLKKPSKVQVSCLSSVFLRVLLGIDKDDVIGGPGGAGVHLPPVLLLHGLAQGRHLENNNSFLMDLLVIYAIMIIF